MKHKHWSIIIGLLVAISMTLAACSTPTPEVIEKVVTELVKETVIVESTPQVVEKVSTATPKPGVDKQGGTLVMGFYQEPETLAPFIRTATIAKDVGALFERGLVKVLPDGTFAPDLAKEVPTVQNGGVSADGLTVTYHLKDNIVWSDGEPFTCQDVVYTWETIMHPDSGAVTTSGYKNMESVTCQDNVTLVIKYSTFYGPYLTLFSGVHTVLPSHLGLDPAKMTEWEINRDPISLGPFVLEEWASGDHMTVVRNEKYELWESEGKPYLDAIVLRWIESREVGKQLVQTGELDFVWDLTEADIPEAQAWDGVVISSPPSTGTERLVFNLRDPEVDAPCTAELLENPHWHWALGDARVREAIELGIDKQKIVDKLLYGLASVGTTELNLGWAKSDIPRSEYNPEKAMALLEEAGWTDTDGDGVRECHGCPYAKEGKVLKLKIQTTSGNKLREMTEQVILEMLEEIGLQLYIENVASAELFASYANGAFRRHGQYDIIMYTASPRIDPHRLMYVFYHSDNIPCDDNNGSGSNYNRWIDEEADKWIDVAGSSPDLQVRADAYQKMAERIAEGRPQIFLYDRMKIDLLSADFMGWDPNIWASLAWNADEWWVKK